ncbi:MAG: hypothetical protein E7629_03150 [Ruminococcaceae bacterium]|nr:hypothetical protein [Oscillospiraceae bacterium]
MQYYFYLFLSVLCVASTNVIGKRYNQKNAQRIGASSIYNFFLLSAVFFCWLILFLRDRTYNAAVIPYSLLFALCYTLCHIGTINALKLGSVMLTSLFGKLSLILVSVWGFFFWNQNFTPLAGVGLLLTAVALWLCLYQGKGGEGVKPNLKWLGCLFLVLFGNAGCSIVQRNQQVKFEGKYGSFLMVVATGVSLLVCLMLYLRSDKRDSGIIAKTAWYFPVTAGIANALLNLLVIRLATSPLSPSLIYPTLAVGSLILISLTSLLMFREKMRPWQWCGVLLGIVATGILSV